MAVIRPTNKPRSKIIVDDNDHAWLSQWKWWIDKYGYVKASIDRRFVLMHRLILGVTDSAAQVDHENRKRHDNRRGNLRVSTVTQNYWNRGRTSRSTSGYRGVYQCKITGKWRADIMHNGKRYNLGRYTSAVDAAKARDAKARELYGVYAWVNIKGKFKAPPSATREKSSRFRGIHYCSTHRHWSVCIYVGGKKFSGGRHRTEENAAHALWRLLSQKCPDRLRTDRYRSLDLLVRDAREALSA